MKRVISLACIKAFSFLVIASCGGPGNSAEIRGRDYSYSIPPHLLRSGEPSLFGDPVVADEGRVVSLLFDEESGILSGSILLIFWDKVYDVDVVTNLATTRFRDAGTDLVRNDEYGIFEFAESIGNSDHIYFTTFDPRSESNRVAQDFFAHVSRTRSFSVGGRQVEPQATCRIYFVIDGLLFQVGRVGQMCSFPDLSETAESVRRLATTWRVPD